MIFSNEVLINRFLQKAKQYFRRGFCAKVRRLIWSFVGFCVIVGRYQYWLLLMNFDDDLPKRTKPPAIGDDLYDLSVEEIRERISLFEAEIARLQQVCHQKSAGIDAAEALFGKS